MRVDEFLVSVAQEYGHKPAILTARASHSFTELNRKADRLAAALVAHGVSRGDTVVAFLDDGVPAAIALFGVLRSGCVLCPVAPSTSADALARILAASGAVGIVTESRLASVAAAAIREAPAVRLVVVSGADRSAVAAGCLSFADVVGALSGSVSTSGIDAASAAVTFPTRTVENGRLAFDVVTHAGLVAGEPPAAPHADDAVRVARPFASRADLVDFVAALRAGHPQRLHGEAEARRLRPAPSGFADARLALA